MKKQHDNLIDHLIFKNKILYGTELIFDYKEVTPIKNVNLSESDIDTKAVSILKKLGWKEDSEIRQHKTSISEIDDHLKSKTSGSERKGHADIYLLIDDKVKILVDNKNPKQSIANGIDDAIFYAKCLLEKKYDIRITLSYNGLECVLRVFDSDVGKWVPFTIDDKEINAFPSRELIDIIYRYKNITGISITDPPDGINIQRIIQQLKEVYRSVPHIQNDNQNTMDFTIAFIALKSILEKHGSDIGKNWSDFEVSEQKRLKELIKIYVEDIVDSLENGYAEIFKIQEDPKGKIKTFDFIAMINQFSNKIEENDKGHLVQIFEILNQLPHLHSSEFDPFAEVYQSLMDKHTRKIFGQFFTPRHLIKTLVRLFYEDEIKILIGDTTNGKVVNPKSICDPACGTGGFLTESFKFIASQTTNIDVRDFAKKTINGFDIYPANTARSRINMYLAGDGFSKIDPLDCLKDINSDTKFNYILTNPPFGKGDYSVDINIMPNKRKEVNFLIKVVKMLKPDGKALIIVPDGILEAPTLAPLRKWLIENCMIEKIIGLPKHEFAPYTHEKTFALFLKKRPNTIKDSNDVMTERVWMYIIDTDGYANSDKRFRTGKTNSDGKWCHDELELWRDTKGALHVSMLEESWKKKIQDDAEICVNEWDEKIEGKKYGYVGMNTIFTEKYTFFKTISKSEIVKLLKKEKIPNPPKKSEDLFEVDAPDGEKNLKDDYSAILLTKKISYDSYEDKFFDEKILITKYLLNLDPMNYLRPKIYQTTTFENFLNTNHDLFKEIQSKLAPDSKSIEGKASMKEKIHELFCVWQGYQITDEEIYNAGKGKYPILSGHNYIKGYVETPRITAVPCITIPSKGIVNKLYIQKKPFDANNTIVLIPKDRKKIDLEYFVFTQTNHITSFISSKNTNNYLNKEILNNIEITYSIPSVQEKIKHEYESLICLKAKIGDLIKLLEKQWDIHLEANGTHTTVNDEFLLTVGSDDNLTEKYVYEHQGTTPVYSGTTSDKKNWQCVNRIDYDPSGEYITWAISGKAGTMYLRKGGCCLTRHCGMMIPKIPEKINLEWFILTHQKRIQDFALAKEGLGELKKLRIKQYSFILPDKDIQDKIVDEYKNLLELKRKLSIIDTKITKKLQAVVTV